MALGHHQQGGNVQLLQSLGGLLLAHGQDDQVGLGGQAGLQVEGLGGAHVGQLNELGGGQGVDGPLRGLGLNAHKALGEPQGDAGRGGDVVAADDALRLGSDGDLPAGHVSDGHGVDGLRRHRLGGGGRGLRGLGDLDGGRGGGVGGGGGAGRQRQGQHAGEQDGKGLSQFLSLLLLSRYFSTVFPCVNGILHPGQVEGGDESLGGREQLLGIAVQFQGGQVLLRRALL